MRAYIKTPLVNNSKIIPHAVEHCVWHTNFSIQKSYDLLYWVEWVITPDYTYYEFDNRVNKNQIISYLTSPINKESLEYEIPIFKEEIDDTNYDQRIYEYVIKKYIDPDISLNTYEDIKRKDINDYHKKYYTPDNIIIVDENNFEIVYEWFKANKKKCLNTKVTKSKLDFEWDKYLLYVWKSCDSDSYWEMYFFFWIICFFCFIDQRHKNQTYYYLEPYFYQYKDNCFVIIWDFDYSKLDKNIFESWKKYVLDMLDKGKYFKEKFFLNKYFYWIEKDREDVVIMYKNYSYSDLNKMLNL